MMTKTNFCSATLIDYDSSVGSTMSSNSSGQKLSNAVETATRVSDELLAQAWNYFSSYDVVEK
jgi:hypothetical protein